MKKMYFTYPSNDGQTEIHGICWEPECEVKAVSTEIQPDGTLLFSYQCSS